jgi:hypothetical protein
LTITYAGHLCSALGRACISGNNVAVIERLFELGENKSVVDGAVAAVAAANDDDDDDDDARVDDSLENLLYLALLARRKNVVEYLIDRGGDVNSVRKSFQLTAQEDIPLLNIACQCGFEDIAEVLLDRGAYIDMTCGRGKWNNEPFYNDSWSSLITAIYYEREKVVKLLLERDADLLLADGESGFINIWYPDLGRQNWTPLYWAVHQASISNLPMGEEVDSASINILRLVLEKIEVNLGQPRERGEGENGVEESTAKLKNVCEYIFHKTMYYPGRFIFVGADFSHFKIGSVFDMVNLASYRCNNSRRHECKDILEMLLDHVLKWPIEETDKVNWLVTWCKYYIAPLFSTLIEALLMRSIFIDILLFII